MDGQSQPRRFDDCLLHTPQHCEGCQTVGGRPHYGRPLCDERPKLSWARQAAAPHHRSLAVAELSSEHAEVVGQHSATVSERRLTDGSGQGRSSAALSSRPGLLVLGCVAKRQVGRGHIAAQQRAACLTVCAQPTTVTAARSLTDQQQPVAVVGHAERHRRQARSTHAQRSGTTRKGRGRGRGRGRGQQAEARVDIEQRLPISRANDRYSREGQSCTADRQSNTRTQRGRERVGESGRERKRDGKGAAAEPVCMYVYVCVHVWRAAADP